MVTWTRVSKENWASTVSDVFKVLRQGGVISPSSFTVYIDSLIMKLQSSKAGCWIGHNYYSCLNFADDIN